MRYFFCFYCPQIVRLCLMTQISLYSNAVFFDIETLINVAQPSSILLLGDHSSDFLATYIEQKSILNQTCQLTHISSKNIATLSDMQRHDVAICIDLFEHIEKRKGMQILSQLRDLLCHQYCIALPVSCSVDQQSNSWNITDLFSFALERVAAYDTLNNKDTTINLFKYNIKDYKKTPDWLNSNNWANPEMWGKYWW